MCVCVRERERERERERQRAGVTLGLAPLGSAPAVCRSVCLSCASPAPTSSCVCLWSPSHQPSLTRCLPCLSLSVFSLCPGLVSGSHWRSGHLWLAPVPPSLSPCSLALCVLLVPPSLALQFCCALALLSLSPVLTVCTSILLPLSSFSCFLFLWPFQYILTLLYPPSPRPAEVDSQREGPGTRVPPFLLFWAPTHCPDRHLLGLPLLRWR